MINSLLQQQKRGLNVKGFCALCRRLILSRLKRVSAAGAADESFHDLKRVSEIL